jgi:light-regulated signal transduction histidine kinase (bacteriophytochrome)
VLNIDPAVDDCAAEPIHVPGAIQPSGVLLGIDARTGTVTLCSANATELLDRDQPADLAVELAELAGNVLRKFLPDGPASVPDDAPLRWLAQVAVAGRLHEVLAYRSRHVLVLEFERSVVEASRSRPIYDVVHAFVEQLRDVGSIDALCRAAVQEVRRLTGFGRVLAYRFDAEGHGEVLAEEAADGYQSYAGHWFPASDIPAQARALYRVNRIRVIGDVDYRPVPLRACADPDPEASRLDMTHSFLRSVSPIHLEYMRNMGTRASMSVSIVVRGELWGLISCHDRSPRTVGYEVRTACEHLGQLLAMQVEAAEDRARVGERLQRHQNVLDLVSQLTEGDDSLELLTREPATLLALAGASGAALVRDDRCWCVGRTPTRDAVFEICRVLLPRVGEVWSTDRLIDQLPAAAPDSDVACGVLALSISRVHRHMLLWFRPEYVKTVRWAGEPGRLPRQDDGRVHPRRSFATWLEQVGGRSAPWRESELAAAAELRHALVDVVLRHVTERNQMERALRESEERFRLVVASASLGTFDHDMLTGEVELSAAAQRIFDVDDGRLPLSTLLEKVHPDDVQATQASMQQATDPASAGEYRLRYRIVHRSGAVHWVDVVGRVEFMVNAEGLRQARRRAGVIWDITEHQRLVEGLRLADQRKDEFLAMLAHELRNPLAPLRNALRIFEHESLSDRGRSALAMSDRQIRHMVRLVDDLLEVSRVSRGKIALRCEPMVVATAVFNAVETLTAAIEARGQELRVVVPERPVRIVADPVRVAQVLENLLTNASKYTPPGGHIRVEVDERPAEVEIRVIDDGAGIEPAKIPHLFELFSQLEATMDRAEGGLGIGLALIKRLVVLHGGSVEASSAGRGRGSTFTVRLPRDGPGSGKPVA